MNNDNINKKSNSFNFTDVVKKINSDSDGTPWYKKKVSIISMSSVLGVGALATVIAVPIALTSSSSTIVLPPTSNPTEAIANFNNLQLKDKITMYNTIMADTTNNTAIKDYFFKSSGMSKFFNENVAPIESDPNATGGDPKEIYDEFKAFLPTYKSTTVTYTPSDGTNFLKMKAIGATDSGSGLTTNIGDNIANTNIYCEQVSNLSTKVSKYSFYSPIVDTIESVKMNDDFSMTMTLTSNVKVTNGAFVLFRTSFHTVNFKYKTTIKFSNTTLFPGTSEFVKTKILNLTT